MKLNYYKKLLKFLPAPKKPESTVTGSFLIMITFITVSDIKNMAYDKA